MNTSCTLILPSDLANQLFAHLFPGDNDEHGAVLAAGICKSKRGIRLLARGLYLAKDGIDYIPGQRGYRMLHANFIRDKILYCREQGLCYLAIHNHSGRNAVRFSKEDLASHNRGYPALLDINRGNPVGGLVFAENAIAGDIWLSKQKRLKLRKTTVVGANIERIYPYSPKLIIKENEVEDRQIRLYGKQGQYILGQQKVGIIGAGGIGALLIEYLSGLGVGEIIVADPDRLEKYNRRRIPYSTKFHTKELFTRAGFEWFARFATPKVIAAKNFVKKFNSNVVIKPLFGDITEKDIANEFKDCDFIFLAADSMQARLVFNALIFQYCIPGYQVGSKITHDKINGFVNDIFSVVRPVGPTKGCLLCNGLINTTKLQKEALSKQEREAQAYIDEPDIHAPSVISLNARGASYAADEYMLRTIGLSQLEDSPTYVRIHPHTRRIGYDIPRQDKTCPICGTLDYSTRGKGDSVRLPVRPY